ncbi:MAG TPA: DUF423 domain-containing protein [Crocinitomicaceae bacterium]|nr:DUF423 domain-containing protein [Crocinitomicaceae bacterium]
MNKKILISGISLIIIAIILGAFGAHALKEVLSEAKLKSFETGVRYQMYHGLALFILGLNADRFSFSLKLATSIIFIGVLLFSISIYFLALQESLQMSLKFLGPITPLGGLLMITGWTILLINVIKNKAS